MKGLCNGREQVLQHRAGPQLDFSGNQHARRQCVDSILRDEPLAFQGDQCLVNEPGTEGFSDHNNIIIFGHIIINADYA